MIYLYIYISLICIFMIGFYLKEDQHEKGRDKAESIVASIILSAIWPVLIAIAIINNMNAK